MEQQQQNIPQIVKFRENLQFSLVKEDREKIYTLYDPHNTRYFQFKEYEYAISQLLDGQNTLDEVCQKFEEELDAVLPIETLKAFIKKLYGMGLIEGSIIPPKRDAYSSLLFKKFKLFNPDKLFDIIIDPIRFLFSPLAVKLFFVVIIIAAILFLKHWDEFFTYGMPQVGAETWHSYVVIGIIIVIIISTHEFAHGLSLKNFGGKVPEIGFMLLLFMPAFYCDVSDAWRFPKKEKLFVTFAGGFYEIVVGSIAVIIWCIAQPHIWLSDIAYLIIISSIFTIGINFNPLIRLDGYYILSDYLEIPNLRSESMGFITLSIARLFTDIPVKKYTLKEKIIFTSYSILSTLFIIFMLFILYKMVSGWLIESMRLTGVIISLLILIFFLYSFLKGIIKGATQISKASKQKS